MRLQRRMPVIVDVEFAAAREPVARERHHRRRAPLRRRAVERLLAAVDALAVDAGVVDVAEDANDQRAAGAVVAGAGNAARDVGEPSAARVDVADAGGDEVREGVAHPLSFLAELQRLQFAFPPYIPVMDWPQRRQSGQNAGVRRAASIASTAS
jgi:hypothetical protein